MKTSVFFIVLAAGLTSQLYGQTVMLPSQQVFRYSGSVLVPDQGTVYLGGVRRGAQGQSRFGGLPGNRRIGASQSAGGMSVSAYVINLDEQDRLLLGGTPREFLRQEQARDRAQNRNRSANPATVSQCISPLEEGKNLVRYARKLARKSQFRSARNAYSLAISMLPEPYKSLAIKESRTVGLDSGRIRQ